MFVYPITQYRDRELEDKTAPHATTRRGRFLFSDRMREWRL